MEESDIDLTVAGTMDAVNMVESGSKEVSEDDMCEIGKIAKETSGKAVVYFIKDPEDIIMNISYNGDRPNWETLFIKD